jgi:hypothetical protein
MHHHLGGPIDRGGPNETLVLIQPLLHFDSEEVLPSFDH